MKPYRGVTRPMIIILATGILGCSSELSVSSSTAAARVLFGPCDFESYSLGELAGQDDWHLVQYTHSPHVFGPIPYQDNVVKLLNQGEATDAGKDLIGDSSGPVNFFEFDVRVNEEVPRTNSHKARLSLGNDDGFRVVKFYLDGTNILACGGTTYADEVCKNMFPGDNAEPFRHDIYYHVTAELRRASVTGRDTGAAIINVAPIIKGVIKPSIVTHSVPTVDDPVVSVGMTEFGNLAGAVLLDNLFGHAAQ